MNAELLIPMENALPMAANRVRTFRLPNGTTTNSATKYCNAWREFAKPIEKALNVEVFAYDPGIQVMDKDNPIPYGQSWSFDITLCKKLIAAFTKPA